MLCPFDDPQSPHHRPGIPRSLRIAPPYASRRGQPPISLFANTPVIPSATPVIPSATRNLPLRFSVRGPGGCSARLTTRNPPHHRPGIPRSLCIVPPYASRRGLPRISLFATTPVIPRTDYIIPSATRNLPLRFSVRGPGGCSARLTTRNPPITARASPARFASCPLTLREGGCRPSPSLLTPLSFRAPPLSFRAQRGNSPFAKRKGVRGMLCPFDNPQSPPPITARASPARFASRPLTLREGGCRPSPSLLTPLSFRAPPLSFRAVRLSFRAQRGNSPFAKRKGVRGMQPPFLRSSTSHPYEREP